MSKELGSRCKKHVVLKGIICMTEEDIEGVYKRGLCSIEERNKALHSLKEPELSCINLFDVTDSYTFL